MDDGMEAQNKYVAVKPNGKIMGPVGDTIEFVQTGLKIGHIQAGGSGDLEDIFSAGYSIWKASITKIEKVNP